MKKLYVVLATDHIFEGGNTLSTRSYINLYYTYTKEEAMGLFVKGLPPIKPNIKRWDVTCHEYEPPKQPTKWWEGFLAGIATALFGILIRLLLHI